MSYNLAAGLTIVALLYTTVVIIIFFSKKNINTIESNLFKYIMISTLLSCLIEFYIKNFMVSVGLPRVANDIINKIAFGNNEFYCLILLLYLSCH